MATIKGWPDEPSLRRRVVYILAYQYQDTSKKLITRNNTCNETNSTFGCASSGVTAMFKYTCVHNINILIYKLQYIYYHICVQISLTVCIPNQKVHHVQSTWQASDVKTSLGQAWTSPTKCHSDFNLPHSKMCASMYVQMCNHHCNLGTMLTPIIPFLTTLFYKPRLQ